MPSPMLQSQGAPFLAAGIVLAFASAAGAATPSYAFTVVAPRSVSPSQVVARVIIEAPNASCPRIKARTLVRPAGEGERADREG
jgi:hypothetical protein